MPPKSGMVWDGEAERKILLALLKDPGVGSNVNWENLAKELSSDTVICTVGALRKRISRLRVAAQKGEGSSGDDNDNDAEPGSVVLKTPASNGKGKTGKASAVKTPAKGKAKGKTPKRSAFDSTDDEQSPLPKKKQKVADADDDADEQVNIKAEPEA